MRAGESKGHELRGNYHSVLADFAGFGVGLGHIKELRLRAGHSTAFDL